MIKGRVETQALMFPQRGLISVEIQKHHSLSQLLSGFPVQNILGTFSRQVSSVAFDSRKADEMSLFVAIHGTRQDGNQFIRNAVSRGAVAFITEEPLEHLHGLGLVSSRVTAICVDDARHALSWVSARFYNHPSHRLKLVGITGTNGKTTLTYLLEALFREHGETTGVIGTINYRYGSHVFPAPVTTPESLDLNHMLDEMAREKVKRCFLEVSSHALALKRVHEMKFDIGVFTNLSRDHLDFHGTMENYRDAKLDLFRKNDVARRVVNIDDPIGRSLMKEFPADTLSTGIDGSAEIRAENLKLTENGSRFLLKTPSGDLDLQTPLLGRHNVYNLLSAAATGLLQGLSLSDIDRGLRSIRNIPGRFERLEMGQDFVVAVDYAHTGDALENALKAARTVTRNRLIAVFGCGGDRDRGKRKDMGRIGTDLADYAVITSDNPRSENPQSIINEILQGIGPDKKQGIDFDVYVQRREAIERAIGAARPGDMVLIAGKG
ncbi:MAG: UDP-N-acetylmuramoyl-L-alanyl-D-glutamate--2,6-diaminopimelate ligase, partial [Nitrospinae bacterium CG11_big_fil_rev_8_21_14_0_20_56_8]